jgi:hypothetical protein
MVFCEVTALVVADNGTSVVIGKYLRNITEIAAKAG